MAHQPSISPATPSNTTVGNVFRGEILKARSFNEVWVCLGGGGGVKGSVFGEEWQ